MEKLGLLIMPGANPGKEQEVADFVKGELPLAEQENETISWYALQIGPSSFGIIDTCKKLSAFGSIGGIITFLMTLTFMLSTPGVIQQGMSFPFISGSPGQFLIRDLVLPGASLWAAGEPLAASEKIG